MKPLDPYHHIAWQASTQRYLVRIRRDGKQIINRAYQSIHEAIEVRDFTLANGHPPPRTRALHDLANRNICWSKQKQRWLVRIRTRDLGEPINRTYATLEEARAARDQILATIATLLETGPCLEPVSPQASK
jgi:hypothetical protein